MSSASSKPPVRVRAALRSTSDSLRIALACLERTSDPLLRKASSLRELAAAVRGGK